MRTAAFAILFFWFGLLFFYAKAVFGFWFWDDVYFIWDKTKDVSFVLMGYAAFPKLKRFIVYPLIVASARALWEIIAFIWNLDVQSKMMVNAVFLTSVLFITAILFKEFQRWQKLKY